jgi:hypothetical protein
MFKKIFFVVLSTFSLTHAVDDFSSERLLGIEVGYTTTTTKANGVQVNARDVESGIRLGAQNEEWRTTLAASFLESNGRDYQKVMLSFDRFVWHSFYKTDSIDFKPYLGAHVGWLRYSEDVVLSDNGLAYGGQLGLALNVINQVDFDVSYRHTVTDIEQVEEIGSFLFGINYIY